MTGDRDLPSRPSQHLPTEALTGGGPEGVAGAPPERIGAYRLIRQLGEGGMGEVWLAEQLDPVRREVALKLIKPGLGSREVLAAHAAMLAAYGADNPRTTGAAGSLAALYEAWGRPADVARYRSLRGLAGA